MFSKPMIAILDQGWSNNLPQYLNDLPRRNKHCPCAMFYGLTQVILINTGQIGDFGSLIVVEVCQFEHLDISDYAFIVNHFHL